MQEVTGSSPVPSTKTTRLIRVGSFCFGGRYRTRTAAEATAACGGNREPRLGQRSDFSKPCQGAAEKSANATRTGASRQIPSRFPTPRNVYQERCRPTHSSRVFLFWWMVQDENRNKQRQGIIVVMVSCLLLFLIEYGILGSVQQIGICRGKRWWRKIYYFVICSRMLGAYD